MIESKESRQEPWQIKFIPYRLRPEALSETADIQSKDGKAAAAEYLEANMDDIPAIWRAEALSQLARLHKRLGNTEATLQALKLSRTLHRATGNLSMFMKDATVTVHTLIIDAGMQLDAARKIAESMQGVLPTIMKASTFFTGPLSLPQTKHETIAVHFFTLDEAENSLSVLHTRATKLTLSRTTAIPCKN